MSMHRKLFNSIKTQKKLFFCFCFCFCFFVSKAFPNEDVIIVKYGYGRINWGDKRSSLERPEIYPLQDSYEYQQLSVVEPNITINTLPPHYIISDDENKSNQDKYKISVQLSVQQQISGRVLASIYFDNRSTQNYFILKDRLPRKWRDGFGAMCDASFLITTNQIKLDYLGRYCEFESIELKNYWQKIPAGNNFSSSVLLDLPYEFLLGRHRYNIGSIEYFVVNDEWFIDQWIYKSFFSILEGLNTPQTHKGGCFYLHKVCYDENNPKEKDTLKFFLKRFGFEGKRVDSSFEIRTNQVVLEIDGDKLPFHHYNKR